MSRKLSYVSAIDFALSILSQIDAAQVAIHDDDLGTSHDVSVGEVVEKLTALREKQAARSATKAEGPTKAQLERAALASRIGDAMEPGVTYGNAEIAALLPELAGATPQRLSPLMALLGKRIVTSKVKGKNYYTLA